MPREVHVSDGKGYREYQHGRSFTQAAENAKRNGLPGMEQTAKNMHNTSHKSSLCDAGNLRVGNKVTCPKILKTIGV